MSYIEYANQGATRRQPLSPRLTQALGFLPDLGVTARVFSGGQPSTGNNRVGSTRHDHGDAADVLFFQGGRQLDWRNPEDVPIYQQIVSRGRAAGLTGFGAGENYMTPGSMHIGIGAPAVWGADGSGANAPQWLRDAYQGAPAGQAPTNTQMTGVAMNDTTQQQPSGGELSRNQRMMLGFAALRDAGAALQGQNSSFFADTMGGFIGQQQAAEDRAFRQAQFDESRRQFEARLAFDQARAQQGQGPNGLPAAIQTLQMRAEMAGLVPGTPEYQEFMLTGGSVAQSDAPQDPAAVVALVRRAEMAGLVPGTPEYEEFMLTGGVVPSSFRALDLAARAAGFVPVNEGGDGSYEEFIRTGGVAARAEAQVLGEAAGEQSVQVQALERSLPVLRDFVEDLRAVGEVAEYRFLDEVAANFARQQGEPLSEGAIARQKYTSMVDNQILPLLKATFGAAFTVVEGERLRATLGDESLSPAEKNAQLDAFIEAKVREIRALGGQVPDSTPLTGTPDTTELSDEELMQMYGASD